MWLSKVTQQVSEDPGVELVSMPIAVLTWPPSWCAQTTHQTPKRANSKAMVGLLWHTHHIRITRHILSRLSFGNELLKKLHWWIFPFRIINIYNNLYFAVNRFLSGKSCSELLTILVLCWFPFLQQHLNVIYWLADGLLLDVVTKMNFGNEAIANLSQNPVTSEYYQSQI